MPDALDLTAHAIDAAVNGALLRGRALALAYVDDDGAPSQSFRGSAQVLDATTLAIWSRKQSGGLVDAIASRPQVSLLFLEPDGPGPRMLSFRGRARVDRSADDTVYAAMIEGERAQDPERGGVAVLIDVDEVRGLGADGPFQMERDAQ